ncbi:MAG: hypothetical protein OIN86_11215 [Candidatus Methanoperedens sp.]|nr:hypothetical protein [Candidatus Methanoperedens sp.]CAG1009697.1 hypothetical protein METP1_03763 [Methanosarcinales archaeon]
MKSCCEIDNAASRHSCCDIKVNEDTAICKECNGKGKPAREITIESLVKEPQLEAIESPDGFYYCETPTCGVVYFNNERQVYLHKEDVKVRVGIKETESPISICYCFGWTQERIFEQIKQQGNSTAVKEISAKIKSGECECEIKNPSGRCCLGDVNKMVKKGMGP